jgi:hypothetical protein
LVHGQSKGIAIIARPRDLRIVAPVQLNVQRVRFEAVIIRHIERLPMASGFAYEDSASARSLVDGYRFGNPNEASAQLLLDVETENCEWLVDLSRTGEKGWWWDGFKLRAPNPVSLAKVRLRLPGRPQSMI